MAVLRLIIGFLPGACQKNAALHRLAKTYRWNLSLRILHHYVSKPQGGEIMIARIWRGATREADKDTYFEYLQKTGLKEYASIPGNQGVWVLRRVYEGKSEFTLISHWDSWDA